MRVFLSCSDVCPCLPEAQEHTEQAAEQDGGDRLEEDPDGLHSGCSRTARG